MTGGFDPFPKTMILNVNDGERWGDGGPSVRLKNINHSDSDLNQKTMALNVNDDRCERWGDGGLTVRLKNPLQPSHE